MRIELVTRKMLHSYKLKYRNTPMILHYKTIYLFLHVYKKRNKVELVQKCLQITRNAVKKLIC